MGENPLNDVVGEVDNGAIKGIADALKKVSTSGNSSEEFELPGITGESTVENSSNEDNTGWDIIGNSTTGNSVVGNNTTGGTNKAGTIGGSTFKVAGTNLPAKPSFWTKVKNVLCYEIKVELTPYQQKIEDEINEFLHAPITWKSLKEAALSEVPITFRGKRIF
jgi:hypothetical protein